MLSLEQFCSSLRIAFVKSNPAVKLTVRPVDGFNRTVGSLRAYPPHLVSKSVLDQLCRFGFMRSLAGSRSGKVVLSTRVIALLSSGEGGERGESGVGGGGRGGRAECGTTLESREPAVVDLGAWSSAALVLEKSRSYGLDPMKMSDFRKGCWVAGVTREVRIVDVTAVRQTDWRRSMVTQLLLEG